MRDTVLIGMLGPMLDSGRDSDRWDRWRPSVDLCQQDDLLVARFELIAQKKYRRLAEFVANDLAQVSPETEVRIHDVDLRDPWDFEEVYGALHDFASAYTFDPEAEDYLIHMTTGTHVAQICLFLLVESHVLPGRLIQASPPPRRSRQGRGVYSIIDLDLGKYDRIASRFHREQTEGLSFLKSGIATRNAAFNDLIARVERVAIASTAPILLTGPTGVGKSQLARRIYELKKRRRQVEGEFVEVNCATLRGDAAMSALFGHVKGAFTGALADRPGLLRTADRGILLLDEIGELGPDEQAMLLRAVEEKRFLPVGTDREVESDFQLIAGTHRDLAAEVRVGRFREDLLARINLWTFAMPALADRREDIEPNLDFELEQWEREHGERIAFNKEARRAFLRFATAPDAIWSGNFRDFNAALVRMATLSAGGRIGLEVVREEIERLRAGWHGLTDCADDAILRRHLSEETREGLDRFDRIQLSDVLAVCAMSRSLSDAGRKLFSVSRTRRKQPNDADRLRKYLAKFGLTWAEIVDPDRAT